MSLDKRSTSILMQLVNSSSYLSIKELTERLNVSRRTIYYDLDKINHWLESQGLSKVEQVRSAGLILSDETKEQIPNKVKEMQAWHYEFSATERRAWIALYLLVGENPFYLESFVDKLRVSRNTIIEDIKSLKTELQSFNLQLDFNRKNGYFFVGDEEDIRKAIGYYLSLAIPEQNSHSLLAKIQMQLNTDEVEEESVFDIETIEKVFSLISESEKKLNIQFTDDVLHSLSLRLVIFSKRVLLGKHIKMDSVEKEVLRDTKTFKIAKNICLKLEEIFKTSFPEDEQFYITTHLLGARVNYSEEDFRDQSINEDLRQVSENMVNDFQKYACILFHDRDMLVKNLLLHLKPTYYRAKYGLEIDNSIVESVKTKYEEVFLLSKKVVHSFEKLVGKPIHENEIAYIAIHFGGWMRKEGAKPTSRKKALIVCANGVGTSQILKQQLEGLFSTIDITDSVSVREYEDHKYDVDLVISTTSVMKKDHPTFVVNPILTDAEKEGLLKKVNALFGDSKQQSLSLEGLIDVVRRHATILDKEKLLQDLKEYLNRPEISLKEHYKPNLSELLNEETIQIVDTVSDWKEAISLAAKPLLQSGAITKNYINEMIHNIEKYGPYIVIAPKIAIPHSKPEHGVQNLGMSLIKLQEAVSFSEQSKHDVHFIVVLAAYDNESHLKALSQLTDLLSKEENILKMMTFNSSSKIYQFIKQSVTKK